MSVANTEKREVNPDLAQLIAVPNPHSIPQPGLVYWGGSEDSAQLEKAYDDKTENFDNTLNWSPWHKGGWWLWDTTSVKFTFADRKLEISIKKFQNLTLHYNEYLYIDIHGTDLAGNRQDPHTVVLRMVSPEDSSDINNEVFFRYLPGNFARISGDSRLRVSTIRRD